MKITLSIVTYNNKCIIGPTLDSINKHYAGKILVVDNASTDGTREYLMDLANDIDNLEILPLKTNIGFGKAHNIAIEKIDSDYHIICNPDIRLRNETISKLAEYMSKRQDVGLVVPKFFYEDGHLQASNRQLPSIFDLYLRRFCPMFLQRIFQKRMEWYENLHLGYDYEYEVPSVSGAFLFCRTNVLKKVGGFDKRYFMYFEDSDLGRQMRNLGYRTMYNPNAEVVHVWQRQNHSSLKMTIVFIRNGIRYFNKWGWKIF